MGAKWSNDSLFHCYVNVELRLLKAGEGRESIQRGQVCGEEEPQKKAEQNNL